MLLTVLSWLPLPLLYALCGGAAQVLRITGWRKRLVTDGLVRCLPDRDESERRAIAREFYAVLGRLVAEFLHAARLTPEELDERLRFENEALVRDALADGRRVLILVGHHCNWEWLLLQLSRRFGEQVVVPYKPISLGSADRWVQRMRARFGAAMVLAREIGPYLVANRRKAKFIAMAADQSPPARSENQVWLPFFGQDTSFFPGPGWIGERLRFEPVFVAMRPDGPGRYIGRLVPLGAPGERLDADRILKSYVQALEEQIRRYPANYFWAYNRWKRPKPADA